MRRLGETIEERTNYLLYHKGEIAGHRGVGFLIKKIHKNNIEEFVGISDRIAILNIRFSGYKKMWSIIQVYAPTEQANAEELDFFYTGLSDCLAKYSNNYVIIMGDLNAQIGSRKSGEELVIGKYGHGKRSPHGQKLVDFLLEHNLTILNTVFKQKYNKKWTWISPEGKYKNEIDYMITNYLKPFTNTKVIQNLNFNTNHRMA